MGLKNTVQAIALSSIDSATFTGAYQVVNTLGLPQSCFLIRIINNSNIGVTVSYNGTMDNDFVRAGESMTLNFQGNSQPNNHVAKLPVGTKVYVKAAAGAGFVYLAGYFQPVQLV